MALADENAKMKKPLFILSIAAGAGILANGQRPSRVVPAANREIVFGNGARMVRQGDQVIIIDRGRRYAMSRRDAKPPPVNMPANCRGVKAWLDHHGTGDRSWNKWSIWWSDHCLK